MAQKRVTSREVAKRAGVSRTTVSFVLNDVEPRKVGDATRQRVLRAAAELGYIPDASARALVSRKAATIGLIVNNAEHLRVDAFINQVLHRLTHVCSTHRYRLLIETSEGRRAPYDYRQIVEENRIDGLVVINPEPHDPRLAELIERRYPIVLVGHHPDPRVATISVNSFEAMRNATWRMIRLGHVHIGFIHYREVGSLDAGGRFGGYRQALAEAGLTMNAALVRSGNYDAESGFRAMASLLSAAARPSAVMTGNDTIAIGAIAAVANAGLSVPDDVAVVGFDDIPIGSFMVPPLTTIRVPVAAMAERAGEMVIRLIQDDPIEEHRVRFPTEMVVRSSCGERFRSDSSGQP